jgi:hypothetical protein
VPSPFNRSPAARAALPARIVVLDSKGGGFMARIVLTLATLALSTFGLQGFVHAQSCGAGTQASSITVATTLGPSNPPWTNLPILVPQFSPAAGQTLIRADITLRGGVSGSVELENLSTTGPCTANWSLASSLEVDIPVPNQPPFISMPSHSGIDNLSTYDGITDFRGTSGVTHIIPPTFTQSDLTIIDPGVLASVFSGSGNVSFLSSALASSSHTGCGNLATIFLDDTEIIVSIVYTYCGAGSDMCAPGAHGVMTCPCGNPQSPAGSIKGCNNSSATGGAKLSSGGAALLSADTVVFSTSGEKPTATSVVLQGDALIGSGTTFGQGVRCAGGTLVRLYTKTAASGSIVAPAPGDPAVSARSAALGDTIVAGQTRWYLVYYRDPNVLGGCPVSSTFNATQGQAIAWQP